MGGEKPAGLQVVGLVGGTQRPPPADALLPTSLVLGGATSPVSGCDWGRTHSLSVLPLGACSTVEAAVLPRAP